jgi:1-acyl-sn-glycerol-3-phosphate acyltransferase
LKSIYWFFRATFQAFFKIFNRLEVVGSDCVPKTGGVIVAVNHVSYLDPLVIGAALRRRATYMAREGLFKLPLIGTFVGSFSFPVRRGKPRPSTIKEAVKRLNRGELIVMFPEGGRSDGGDILDAKRGVGVIAVMSKAPIVPALISGTERSLPVGAKVVKPAKIKVIFGKSIEINREEPDKQFQERICRNIMDEIRKLKG